MRFWLGTHQPHWLEQTAVPLFVSRRRLAGRRKPLTPLGPLAIDSGGFSELSLFGHWQTSAEQYADEVSHWHATMPGLSWAAAQDWMCEPIIRLGGSVGKRVIPGTGLSVREHQERTIVNYLFLRERAPGLPWLPVLQGWGIEDYLDHAEQYRAVGVEPSSLPLVGLGSVCRRQSTDEVLQIVRELSAQGIRLHGFGVKLQGLAHGAAARLASADSMAWSYNARRNPPLPGCAHARCNNCLRWALAWRVKALKAAALGQRRYQPMLFEAS